MSSANVEIARRGYATLNRAYRSGDVDEFASLLAEFLDPEIVLVTAGVLPDSPIRGTVQGLDNLLAVVSEQSQAFEKGTAFLEAMEFIDAGDQVVVPYRFGGRGRHTEIEVEFSFTHVVDMRDGKAVRIAAFETKEEALEATGSRENVDNLQALLERWDLEAWRRGEGMSLLDPEVIYEDTTLPDHVGEKYRGHEGVGRATERWAEAYEELTINLDRIVGAGDNLVSIHLVRGRARHTGIEGEGPLAYLWTFRGGKVIHFQSYRDPAEALEAAGVADRA